MAWIRFDTAVLFDDFCSELSGDEFKAWCYLLLYIKASGARGSAPVVSHKRLSKMATVSERAVERMFEKAGDKFRVENGRIYVKNWRKYQEDYRDKSVSPEKTGDGTEATTPQYNNTTVQDTTVHKEKIVRARKVATPEKLEDVTTLFAERGYTPWEAEKFWNYYTANGWKVGRNPMKDWKAAAANWNKNAKEWGQQSRASPPEDKPRKNRWEYCFVCKENVPPYHKCKAPAA